MFNHINFESINRGLNYCIDWSQLITKENLLRQVIYKNHDSHASYAMYIG